ncbi:UNVERIFIED_CONTAM: hypothetical protein RMT77_019021 [Armadillidium vulgare]
MTTSGVLHRLQLKWWPNILQEPDSQYPTPGLNEVFTLLLILGCGILLSVFCLGLENVFMKRKKPFLRRDKTNLN